MLSICVVNLKSHSTGYAQNAHVLLYYRIKSKLSIFRLQIKNTLKVKKGERKKNIEIECEYENREDMNKKYKLQALTTYHNFANRKHTLHALNPDDL